MKSIISRFMLIFAAFIVLSGGMIYGQIEGNSDADGSLLIRPVMTLNFKVSSSATTGVEDS